MTVDREYSQKYAFERKPPRSQPSSSSPRHSPTSSTSFHPSNPFADDHQQQDASLLDAPIREPRHQQSSSRSARPSSRSLAPSSPSSSSHPRARASSAATPHGASLSPHQEDSRVRSASSNPPPRHQRNSSLPQRFAGDMSHRPLDVIKHETRTAHRNGRRHRRGTSQSDQIDALDTIGGGYHHDGPYEAVLASRNVNKRYAPLEAVRDSNMEAIRATPKEYIDDSLMKHVPLQGTATVPRMQKDLSGNVMDYEEGADLMREADAPGGAYKRWDGIRYHPEDYKGKGEPSYTYERDQKSKQSQHLLHPDRRADDVEMRGFASRPKATRSLSNGAYDEDNAAAGSAAAGQSSADHGVQRSHTVGGKKRLSEGIRRRFGSIKGKRGMPAEKVS